MIFLVFAFLVFSLAPSRSEAAQLTRSANNFGLVGYWSFNEGTSTTVGDYSGNQNTGTLTNMATPATASSGWGIGRFGKGLNFDGTNDYVTVPDSSLWDFGTGEYTISAWIKAPASAAAGDYRVILARDQSPYYYQLNTEQTSGKLELYSLNAGSNMVRSDTSVIDGAWHHVVATRRSGVLYLYIDGVQQSSTRADVQNVSGSSAALQIGRRQDGSHPFLGQIDEVRLYSRGLSATQISSLYAAGLTRVGKAYNSIVTTGLLAHWTFDTVDNAWTSPTAGTTLDKSGTGNTGTLAGMSVASTPALGKVNQAFNFDGVNDYVTDSALAPLGRANSPYDRTVCFWADGTGAAVVNARNSSAIGMGAVVLSTSRNLQYSYTSRDNSPFTYTVTSTAAGSPSTMSHYCARYSMAVVANNSSANMDVDLFVDGVKETKTLSYATRNPTELTQIDVGRSHNHTFGDSYFTGRIDDVRIYDRLITDAEVAQLYAAGNDVKVNFSKNAQLTSGLIGLWSFDGKDISNGVLLDRSGSGNNGTPTSIATSTFYSIGKFGQGGNFSGSTDYVALSTYPIATPNSDWTISLWMKPASLNQNGFVYYNGKGGIGIAIAGTGGTDSAGNRLRGVFDGVAWLNTSHTFSSTDTWKHVVLRRTGTTVEFFADGVVVATFTSTPNSTIYSAANIGGTASRNFNGSIDEVRVYTRSLSNEEITQLYNLGR